MSDQIPRQRNARHYNYGQAQYGPLQWRGQLYGRWVSLPVTGLDGRVEWEQMWESAEPPHKHIWHDHKPTYHVPDLDSTAVLDALRVMGEAGTHQPEKATHLHFKGKVRRSWNVGWRRWAKYPLWAVGLGLVLAVILFAVGSIGAACLAHCPMP